jgi:subtilisin family serine protease
MAALLGSILAVAQPLRAQQAGDIVPGRYIVIFDSDTTPGAAAADLSRAHGFGVRHVYSRALGGMAIQFPAGAAEAGILTALRRDPRVQSIGADLYVSAVDIVTDGLNRIHGGAYNAGVPSTGAGVTVAVFDTGLDFTHPDLAANINVGLSVNCMISGCPSGGQDDNSHGTFVGGIIAAPDNGTDIVGVVPDATLIAVKVLDANGSGAFSGVIAGVDYVTGLGSNVVQVGNMSLGAFCSVCTDNSTNTTVIAFHTAVDNLVAAGITLVVAAGNDGSDAANEIPASFDSVVTVSAMIDWDGLPGGLASSNDDTFVSFSNFGADIDVIAPGVSVTSLNLGGGTRSGSGTSFSSPYTAGVAAAYIAAGGSSVPADVRNVLIQSGECHEGAGGTLYKDFGGCAEVWPGDPDGIAEPMVRADTVFDTPPPPPVFDVAVNSLAVDTTPIVDGVLTSVSVNVANIGDFDTGDFSVSLTDNGNPVGTQSGVTLAAGSSTTPSLVFDWLPSGSGDHVLTATHNVADEVAANNSKTMTVTVPADPTDVAVLSVSAPATVNKGNVVDVTVDVRNGGTTDETVTVTLADTGGSVAGGVSGPQTFTILAQTQVALTFSWDTTGASEDTHTLTASHGLADDNNTNNSASTTVTVAPTPEAHDVAAVSVDAPGQMKPGDKTVINVLVTNLSTVSEKFLLILTTTGGTLTNTDGSTPGGTRTIGPLTRNGGSTTMNFLWDTTGASKGNHTLTATVTHDNTDGATDENTSNNTASATTKIGNGKGGGGSDGGKGGGKPCNPKKETC